MNRDSLKEVLANLESELAAGVQSDNHRYALEDAIAAIRDYLYFSGDV